MRQFRNNNKRSRYRSNGDKNYKRNGQNSSFIESPNFHRRFPGRNNQNANKLIEKYSDLAREALSNGDKILSENYFQHADHFLRISNDKDKNFVKETNGIYTSSNNQGTSENQKILEPTEVEKKII